MPKMNRDNLYSTSDFSGVNEVISRQFNKGYYVLVERMIEMEELLNDLLEKYITVLLRVERLERDRGKDNDDDV